MKYNLFINQFAAVRMAVKVDIVDLAIFDIVEALMNSKAAVSILKEGTIWYRIPARLIIEQGPLLGIRTERGIAKRLDSLIAAGLLERNSDNNRMQGCFIRLGKRYDEYKFYRNETTQGGTDVPGGWNESSSNNNIINNIPTGDNITSEESITDVISSSSVISSPSGSAREEVLPRRKFTPPTVEQVRDYCDGRGPEYQSIDPEEFVAFYQSKGWMVGKSPMKDWHAALVTWARKRVCGRQPRGGEPVIAPVALALEENERTMRELMEKARAEIGEDELKQLPI